MDDNYDYSNFLCDGYRGGGLRNNLNSYRARLGSMNVAPVEIQAVPEIGAKYRPFDNGATGPWNGPGVATGPWNAGTQGIGSTTYFGMSGAIGPSGSQGYVGMKGDIGIQDYGYIGATGSPPPNPFLNNDRFRNNFDYGATGPPPQDIRKVLGAKLPPKESQFGFYGGEPKYGY